MNWNDVTHGRAQTLINHIGLYSANYVDPHSHQLKINLSYTFQHNTFWNKNR